MADYRSILDRAISGLTENTEDARRTIYDKARGALMRQLSSLEPPLSPAEISKQRLQLEEAVRDTENGFNGISDLESAVSDAVHNIEADVPTMEQPDPVAEPTPEPVAEPTPEPVAEPTPEPVAEPTPEPVAEPTPEPVAEPTPEPIVEPTPEPIVETTPENAEMPTAITDPDPLIALAENLSNQTGDAPSLEEAMPDVEQLTKASIPDIPEVPDTTLELKGLDIIEEAEQTLKGIDAENLNPLDELKQTIAEDTLPDVDVSNIPDINEPSTTLDTPDDQTPLDEIEALANTQTSEMPEEFDSSETPNISEANSDEAALIAAAEKKPSSKGLFWILTLLIIFGIGAFGWAKRDALEPTIAPLFEKVQKSTTDFFSSLTQKEETVTTPTATNENASDLPQKAEDRILDTPLEVAPKETEQISAPEITPGNRITLPTEEPPSVPSNTPSLPSSTSEAETVTPVVPNVETPKEEPIVTPPNNTDASQAPADTTQATTTPVTNIFTASAIFYEERKDSGRPDVSTGNVTWELIPEGSEVIGSTSLPSVRGNARVQNRDLNVRFEIMRNLDEALPASHLIEIEFKTGQLFANDSINNVAGVLMKENEQDNGQQLIGAVVKVSDNVFWIAMSARAADLASNVDAIKKLKWFDIPVTFASGKRAILTLEKSTAGTKALEQAFISWEK
ncbi:MAG: hypothetical protein ABJN24_02155 [Hyphomicrobiales bacterium]